MVVATGDRLTTYEVEPGLEYRTFVHASREPIDYGAVSIRPDGRVLALGTSRAWRSGTWPAARSSPSWRSARSRARFEASGDLLVAGATGVRRWPLRLAPDRREFRIGPPGHLESPGGSGRIAEDRSSRIVVPAGSGKILCSAPDGRLLAVSAPG